MRFLLTIFLLVLGRVTCVAANQSDNVKCGDIEPFSYVFISDGTSNVPLAPGNLNVNRNYTVGLVQLVEWRGGQWQLKIYVYLNGRARYDNVDSGEGGFHFRYRNKEGWCFGVINWNFYSLNALPFYDFYSRRPNSSRNYTGITLGKDFNWDNNGLSVMYTRVERGNFPVGFPSSYSINYVQNITSVTYSRKVSEVILWFRPELYSSRGFSENRVAYNLGFNWKMSNGVVVPFVASQLNQHFGTAAAPAPDTRQIQAGIKISF